MNKLWLAIIALILLIFTLTSNAKPILKYKILGLNKELLTTITNQIKLRQEKVTTDDVNVIKNFYDELPQVITNSLKPYGYFNSIITSDSIVQRNHKWYRIYQVILGPPTTIAFIDLKIVGIENTDKSFQQHLKNFPLKPQAVFQADQYNHAKQLLFDLADNYGYRTAFFANRKVLVDLTNHTAKIVWQFILGPQYYFSHTIFLSPRFSKKFLIKFLPYKLGEPYSNKKLQQARENFSNSNFFKDVTITPKTAQIQQHEVPIEIKLTPHKSQHYNLGLGFSTDIGIHGLLETEFKNLTQTGQSFKSSLQASQVQGELALHYLIPGKQPLTDLYDFNFVSKVSDSSNGKNLVLQVGAGYKTVLPNEWQQVIKLDLQHEHYKLSKQSYRGSDLLIPGVNWMKNKSDDSIKPTDMYGIAISIRGASKYLASTNNFLQPQIELKYLKTAFSHIQLLLRAKFGYTLSNEVNNLPLSLQFYTGGIQSIRGFNYNSIGPGKYLTVGSIELRYKLIKNKEYYLATFFDAGNANNNLLIKPNEGIGVGIIYRTPVGTIKLFYAKAISKPNKPNKIQFSFGPDI